MGLHQGQHLKIFRRIGYALSAGWEKKLLLRNNRIGKDTPCGVFVRQGVFLLLPQESPRMMTFQTRCGRISGHEEAGALKGFRALAGDYFAQERES